MHGIYASFTRGRGKGAGVDKVGWGDIALIFQWSMSPCKKVLEIHRSCSGICSNRSPHITWLCSGFSRGGKKMGFLMRCGSAIMLTPCEPSKSAHSKSTRHPKHWKPPPPAPPRATYHQPTNCSLNLGPESLALLYHTNGCQHLLLSIWERICSCQPGILVTDCMQQTTRNS